MSCTAQRMGGLRVAAFGFRSLNGVEGGIETHARELYPRLTELGCHVTVLTRARYESERRASRDPVVTRPLPAPHGEGIETAVHALLAAIECIAKRPDVVHIHGIGPAMFTPLLRLCGLCVVVTHHGHDYDADKWGLAARLALRISESIGMRCADAVITVSQSLRRDVLHTFGVPGHAIYNGCRSAQDAAVPPCDAALAAASAGRFLLVVGRLTPHKRVEDALAALAALPDPDLRLVVCGKLLNDAYCGRLRACAAVDTRVLLAGYVPPEQLAWLYGRTACTIMSSSYEGMPLAVLEALANNSRVIATDIPAHLELALPADCYYPLGNPAALAERLRGVLTRPNAERPARLGPQFDWATIARQTLAVFEAARRRRRGLAARSTNPNET
jgi:glycosyltransferase involved in cell wall biosynthesis